MNRKKMLLPAAVCMAMLLAACGSADKTTETTSIMQPMETATTQEKAEQPAEQNQAAADQNAALSEDQAYQAVINYCKKTVPDFEAEMNTEGFTEYWDVSTNENGEIVVLYRSYTAAQTRYYVNPTSGEAYVTEFVPGITDEEQQTGDTFNARDYLE